MKVGTPDQRSSRRRRRSDIIEWRDFSSPNEERAGWLLERSDSGMAFAWRGRFAPSPEDAIEVREEGVFAPGRPRKAQVVRVQHCHQDLYVIAVRLAPEAQTAAAAASQVEVVLPKRTSLTLAA